MPTRPTLRMGSKGSDVADLQLLLNQRGYTPKLKADGDFGQKTDTAVRWFQKLKKVTVDGIVGRTTWGLLEGATSSYGTSPTTSGGTTPPATSGGSKPPATNGSQPSYNGTIPAVVYGRLPDCAALGLTTQAQKYDFYVQYIDRCKVNAAAAKADLEKGLMVILGLRINTRISGQGAYDDRFILLTKKDGVKKALEFKGNTEPNGSYANGSRILGRVPEGIHPYSRSTSSKHGDVLRPSKAIMAERDTNHDGQFNDNKFGSEAQTMLFHRGGLDQNSPSGNRTWSMGCQTIPKDIWPTFWSSLQTGQNQFQYVLVTLG